MVGGARERGGEPKWSQGGGQCWATFYSGAAWIPQLVASTRTRASQAEECKNVRFSLFLAGTAFIFKKHSMDVAGPKSTKSLKITR